MEVQLLKDMIDDREQRIALVQRKIDEQSEKEGRVKAELDEARAKNESQKSTLREERRSLVSQLDAVEGRLAELSRDLAQQGSSLKMYAGMMSHEHQQNQKTGGDMTAHVMRMQAQLCKGMHTLGILDHQMDLVKRHADAIVKYQKDNVSEMTEEKSQVELRLMNDLMNIDLGNRDVESELIAKLEEIRKEMEATERQIEENRDSDDEGSQENEDEEEEDEEDEEEKEAKEELLKMLRERREELERLEQETEQQAETIEELEAEVADMKEQMSNGGSPPKAQLRKEFDEALDAPDADAVVVKDVEEPTKTESDEEDTHETDDGEVDHEDEHYEEAASGGDDEGEAFQDASDSIVDEEPENR